MNYWHLCSPHLQETVLAAREIAVSQGSAMIDAEHLVLAMLMVENCTAGRLLADTGVDVQALAATLRAESSAGVPEAPGDRPAEDIRLSARAERVMQATWLEARRAWARAGRGSSRGRVRTEHLLLGVSNPSAGLHLSALHTHGVFYGELAERVRRLEAEVDAGDTG